MVGGQWSPVTSMSETLCVGDKFKMLVTDLKITYRKRSAIERFCDQQKIHFWQISYLKTGLKPNERISVTLSANDTLKNNFQVTDDFETDASGRLSLDDVTFNSFFARAKNNSNNAFLLPEFDKYFINLESTGTNVIWY